MNAYLDIETSFSGEITVVGIYTEKNGTVQIIEPCYDDLRIYSALEGITEIYSFNGDCFDLPVIRKKIGIDILCIARSVDLRKICRAKNLRGGLKKIENILGIGRETHGVDGYMAMVLWRSYKEQNDSESLRMLLRYNRDDVENLIELRKILDENI